MTARIEIEPASLGDRGQRYRVLHEGRELVSSSPAPEFDACRALLAIGTTGMLEIWRRGVAYPAMRLDIEKGAKLAVSEGDHGLRLIRWRPFSEAQPHQDGMPAVMR